MPPEPTAIEVVTLPGNATQVESPTWPVLSIVIPTHNREKVIGRALQSCLADDGDDFEVIVVDGASSDQTVAMVRAFRDPRVRVVCEDVKRGVCPARNTGVDHARADWVLFLDSDNEFVLGAIRRVIQETRVVSDDVEHLRFSCKWANPEETAVVQLEDETWDYRAYLHFLQRITLAGGDSDTLSCMRTRSFKTIRWPDNRAFEAEYHIDFARRYKTRTYSAVLMTYHLDADNRNTTGLKPAGLRVLAPDNAISCERLLAQHGPMLQASAPDAYRGFLLGAAKYHFLAGDRSAGTQRIAEYLRCRPLSPAAWVILLAGWIGPDALARAMAWRRGARKRVRVGMASR